MCVSGTALTRESVARDTHTKTGSIERLTRERERERREREREKERKRERDERERERERERDERERERCLVAREQSDSMR